MRPSEERQGRQIDRYDQLVGSKICILVRSVAWESMEILKLDLPLALRALNAHHCLNRSECHTHVTRMGGDTVVALSKNRMDAVESVNGTATATWLPLIALRKSR